MRPKKKREDKQEMQKMMASKSEFFYNLIIMIEDQIQTIKLSREVKFLVDTG